MKIENKKILQSRMVVSVICASLILALVAGALPTSSAQAVACKFKHKVEAGETLIYIGFLYQLNWYDIAEANDINPPYTLTVGQKLCIPGGSKPSTTTSTSKSDKNKPTMTVIPGVGHILLSVENFSAKTVYYVRIFPGNWPISYRIGHFKTNKEGDYTNYFNVPSYVPRSAVMKVCVKNVWTDKASCINVNDLYTQLDWFSGSTCTKSAK